AQPQRPQSQRLKRMEKGPVQRGLVSSGGDSLLFPPRLLLAGTLRRSLLELALGLLHALLQRGGEPGGVSCLVARGLQPGHRVTRPLVLLAQRGQFLLDLLQSASLGGASRLVVLRLGALLLLAQFHELDRKSVV